MITLLKPPLLEKPEGHTQRLVLYVCDSFDMKFSFRQFIRELGAELIDGGTLRVELPEELPCEDFVHGLAMWGTREFRLYYERSLGYLQFESLRAADLQVMAAMLERSAKVVST